VLQHVSVEIKPEQMDACLGFWRLLGFKQVPKPDVLPSEYRWVERDGTQIHLMTFDDPVVTRRGHAAVVVEDYDAVLATLREHGFDPEPTVEAWGVPRAFVRDPAGNRFELMSAPPPTGG